MKSKSTKKFLAKEIYWISKSTRKFIESELIHSSLIRNKSTKKFPTMFWMAQSSKLFKRWKEFEKDSSNYVSVSVQIYLEAQGNSELSLFKAIYAKKF
jgi:hypothetical protein